VIMPEEILDSDFLAYSLQAQINVIKVISNATTLGILNQEKTKSIDLCAPDIEEQRIIVSFLEDKTLQINDMIDINNQTINRLTEYRTALITAAVTGKIDVRNVKIPDNEVP